MDQVSLLDIKTADPERALLATVVLLALTDACSTPPRPDRNKEKDTPAGLRMTTDAFTAMRFFFDTRTAGLDAYAAWLDFDLDSFRSRLHAIMADNGPNKINGFDPMQRRNFRYNYVMWRKAKEMDETLEETEENEDEIAAE